jgi:hypothetical protein
MKIVNYSRHIDDARPCTERSWLNWIGKADLSRAAGSLTAAGRCSDDLAEAETIVRDDPYTIGGAIAATLVVAAAFSVWKDSRHEYTRIKTAFHWTVIERAMKFANNNPAFRPQVGSVLIVISLSLTRWWPNWSAVVCPETVKSGACKKWPTWWEKPPLSSSL